MNSSFAHAKSSGLLQAELSALGEPQGPSSPITSSVGDVEPDASIANPAHRVVGSEIDGDERQDVSPAKKTLSTEPIEVYLVARPNWLQLVASGPEKRYAFFPREAPAEVVVPSKLESAYERDKLTEAIARAEGRGVDYVRADLERLSGLSIVKTEPFAELKKGVIDRAENRKIDTIIFASTECVVYLDTNLEVVWRTSDSYPEFAPDIDAALSALAEASSEPIGHLPKAMQRIYRTLCAEGIALALDIKKPGSFLAIFQKARSFLQARNDEIGRRNYTISALLTVTLSLSLGACLWSQYDVIDPRFFPGFARRCAVLTFGSIGALISVYSRLPTMRLDPRSGSLLSIEAALRVIVGIVAALVVDTAFRVGVIIPGLAKIPAGTVLLCITSGASERLLPMLIARADSLAEGGAMPAKPATRSAKPEIKGGQSNN